MCQPQGPISSAYSSNNTGLGVFRRMTNSVEPWHLNSAAGAFVLTFIFVQFRALLRNWLYREGRHALQRIGASFRSRREASGKGESWSSSRGGKDGGSGKWENEREGEAENKEFADKQVGSDLDVAVEEHDNILQQSPVEVPYYATSYPEAEMQKRSQLFYEEMKARRSVRCFSTRPVSLKLVQNLVKTAGSAPSGANLQPWTFCVVQSGRIKRAIREVVEEQEQLNYTRRMGAQWVLDVKHLNVNWNKPYLTEAPFLIVVMKHAYQLGAQGERKPTYYSEQSAAIAVGLLLAGIQHVGLVTVVTTPLNAGTAIREILQRPTNEKVSLLLPLGYPAEGVHVPDIQRKSVEEIMRIY